MNPLEKLHDIALPQQINAAPIALGWWLLFALLIGVLFTVFHLYTKRRRLIKSKNNAIKYAMQTPLNTTTAISILKWAAIEYGQREKIASLYGDGFQQFLIDALPVKNQPHFKELSQPCFEHLYKTQQEQLSNENLQTMVIFWLKHALPMTTGAQHV